LLAVCFTIGFYNVSEIKVLKAKRNKVKHDFDEEALRGLED